MDPTNGAAEEDPGVDNGVLLKREALATFCPKGRIEEEGSLDTLGCVRVLLANSKMCLPMLAARSRGTTGWEGSGEGVVGNERRASQRRLGCPCCSCQAVLATALAATTASASSRLRKCRSFHCLLWTLAQLLGATVDPRASRVDDALHTADAHAAEGVQIHHSWATT